MSGREEQAYIYGAARTPVGKFNGALASIPAPGLGAVAMREALARSGVAAARVTEVIMGNVLSAGIGQAPARQAALKCGLDYSAGATTINKVCGSGLKAVMLADDAIRLQNAEFVIAGGMETMSLAPFLLPAGRRGRRLGNIELLDSLIHDGLWDSFNDCHMGDIAEKLAAEPEFGRAAQDRFALESYRRARAAQDGGLFADEIAVVAAAGKGGAVVDKDEQPYANDLNNLPALPPAFIKEGGTITAGNASKINDGAAALVLGPRDPALRPLARIFGQAAHAEAPGCFPVAPSGAIQKLLRRAGLRLGGIDLFEINEAFAIAAMAVCSRLDLDMSKVNVHGGAVALGHPIGASGARILVTLLYALRARNLRRGVAAICLGGGESVALGVELV